MYSVQRWTHLSNILPIFGQNAFNIEAIFFNLNVTLEINTLTQLRIAMLGNNKTWIW